MTPKPRPRAGTGTERPAPPPEGEGPSREAKKAASSSGMVAGEPTRASGPEHQKHLREQRRQKRPRRPPPPHKAKHPPWRLQGSPPAQRLPPARSPQQAIQGPRRPTATAKAPGQLPARTPVLRRHLQPWPQQLATSNSATTTRPPLHGDRKSPGNSKTETKAPALKTRTSEATKTREKISAPSTHCRKSRRHATHP